MNRINIVHNAIAQLTKRYNIQNADNYAINYLLPIATQQLTFARETYNDRPLRNYWIKQALNNFWIARGSARLRGIIS